MISVVIPLYNKEKQIANTLETVFNQTFRKYEIIIVDDGSTDRSLEVVKQINDPRVSIIIQANQGVSAARNTGIREAKYDYIALLDADDEWKPTYLETQWDLINSFPECAVFACAYEFKKESKTSPVILNKMPFQGTKGILSNYFEVASCSHPPICSINVIAKKESFESINGFPVGIKSGEDLLTWAGLAVNNKIAFSRSVEACFVVPEDQSHRSNRLDLNEKDKVHSEFVKLQQATEKNSRVYWDMEKYIGRWNEMTASSLLRSGKGKASRKYTKRALSHKGVEAKLLFFWLLSFMPARIQTYVMTY